MHSSTSSSDSPYRVIPDRHWSQVLLICLILVVMGVAYCEWLARSMQHIPGTNKIQQASTAMWAEERRKLDDPDNPIKLVLIGSSRILWGSDLDILKEEFGTRPLQLAIPGTGPAFVLDSIVNDSDFDGLILIGVTPFLFNDLTPGLFFGDEALEWYEGISPSKHTGLAIHNFLSDFFSFLDDGFSLIELLDHYSMFPIREGAVSLHRNGWKLGNTYADRQTDMWPPVEVEGSFDNEQIIAFWMSFGLQRPIPSQEEMANMTRETIDYFNPLIEKLRTRGGDVMFIRMPGRGRFLERDISSNHKEHLWLPMIEGFGAPAINTMDYPELSSELEIPEWSHLSRESQDLFSRRIVPHIERAYIDVRGISIYETMGMDMPNR